MAIAPITVGDTSARAKINAAIVEANKVAAKAEQSSLVAEASARAAGGVAEAAARVAGDADLQAQIGAKATTAALSAETTARVVAVAAEALVRAQGDLAEAQARTANDNALGVRIDGRATYAEAVAEHDRLGEPGRFATSDIAGAPESVSLLDSKAVSVANGAVVSISAGYAAPIAVQRIEPGRQYRLRFVVQRVENTLDPANDAIRLGVSWLKADKSALSLTVIADLVDITVASGRLEYIYTVSRVDGDTVDVGCPEGGVYARAFVRCYGNGLNHIEVIEWTDLSNSVDWSPDVSEFRNQLFGMEYNVTSLLDRMDGAEQLLEDARDARYITSGTLDDARLSDNVMLLDAEQAVTGDKTYEADLKMVGSIILAPDEDGGGAARVSGDGNSFAIAPTNGSGGFDTLKEFGFNFSDGYWRVEGGFRSSGEMRAGSLQATPIGSITPAAGTFTIADFTDKPTTRTNLDVYSKAETDNRFEFFDALVRKGAIDCSADPNYPAANAGYVYIVSVAGKIGGASGAPVEAGDFLICNVDASAAGTQAAVGTNWTIGQLNIDASAFARTLMDDADAAAMRTTLGLVIGTNVQAYHALLQALSALTTAGDKGLYFTASNTPATFDLTSTARALLDDADATAMRATIGAVIGTDVQAYDADLAALAAIAPANDDFIQRKAGAWVNRTPRQAMSDLRKQATVATDADYTLTPGTSAEQQRHTGTLTANRTITLATASAVAGDVFHVARSGGGAFTLSLGGLKALATGAWATVTYDGAAWYLSAAGTL